MESSVAGMELTNELRRLRTGDKDAMHVIMPLVYDELKKLAKAHLRRESGLAPLDATVLVHEAFLKLAAGRHPAYENRSHFYGIASRLMRQVLVDAARARAADKRAVAKEVALTDALDLAPEPDRSVLAIDDALQQLEIQNSRMAQLIEMRYFGGMTAEECAGALSIPALTVRRELRLAQAWLRREMVSQSQ